MDQRQKYRPEIDGLRAISVLSVILFHADLRAFRGGFVGVDVFFVISGFLITTLLRDELRDGGKVSLGKFYERRARRILPALLVMSLVCLPLAWRWLIPVDADSFGRSLIAMLGFASNIFFYSSTAYFEAAAEWKPLLHTWSLAVEEQYYLFFPLLLLLLRRLRTRLLVVVLAVLAMASLATAQWQTRHNPAAAFYLLPSRGWEILLGALAAFVGPRQLQHLKQGGRWRNQVVSVLGLAAILVAVVAFNRSLPYPSAYTLVPTVGAVLVILFATEGTWAARVLRHPVLVKVGLISYSAYLWHWPLFVFARHRAVPAVPGPALLGALAVASLVLGYLSWRWVEQPFRNAKLISRRRLVISTVACALLLFGIGVASWQTKGFAARVQAPPGDAADIVFQWRENGGCLYQLNAVYPLGQKGLDCWEGDRAASTKAISFGDSYAGAYDAFWDIVGKKSKLSVHGVSTNFCVPTLGLEWRSSEDDTKTQCLLNRKFLAQNAGKYDVAILTGDWSSYSPLNELQPVIELIDYLTPHVRLVVVMAAPKQYDANPVAAYQKSLMDKTVFDISAVPATRDLEQVRANGILAAAASKRKNVLFIDRESLFTVDGIPSEVSRENIPFTLEGNHLSRYGAKSIAWSFMQTQKYKDLITLLGLAQPG